MDAIRSPLSQALRRAYRFITANDLQRGPYSALNLDFLNNASVATFDPRITFTRGSSATYFGSDGLMKVQGYNLLTYSQDQDNGTGWSRNTNILAFGSGSVANAIAAPDGTLTADFVVPDTTSALHRMSHFGTTITTATQYTFSIYAKAGGYRYLFINGAASANQGQVTFDLQSGVVTATTSGTGSIVSAGNGWWRCSVTATSAAVSNSTFLQINDTSVASDRTFVGDGVSGIYLWGAQLEAGSTATQYSPTTTAANSAPRLDYDPVTLLPRGLLVEEARTNLLLQSEDFSTTWGLSNIDAFGAGSVVNAVASPSGAVTADFLRESSSGALSHTASQSVTKAASAIAYSYSVCLKAGTRTWGRLLISNAALTAFASVYVNLSTGAIGASGATATTFTAQSASVQTLANGWYRVTLNATTDTDTTVKCWVGIANADNGATYAGDGASGLYVWGAQLEAGSFPTSYIPTTTASATRSSDSVSMTGTNFSSWYNQTQGTFVVEHDYIANAVQDAQVVVATNSTVSNMLGSRKPNNTTQTILQRIGAANTDITLAAATANTTTKMAHSYDGTGTSGVVNGGTVGTATAWTATDLDRLFIGQRNNASFLNGHIRRIQFFPVRLSNATLQALTS